MNDGTKNAATDAVRTSADRRKAARYPISAAASFEWQDSNSNWPEAIGISRDIGGAGLFLETETIPPIGSLLHFRVTLPARETGPIVLSLSGVGQVRHHYRYPGGRNGFGASVVWHLTQPERSEPGEDYAEAGLGTFGTA